MAEGEGAQSGAGDGTQSGTGETTTTTEGTAEGGTGSSTQSGAETGTANTDLERSRAETESLRERMKAADSRAAKFEQELKQLRDKDLPEIDKLKRDFEETVKDRDALKVVNRNLSLQVAFLSDNTVTWHDPATALKLVDTSKVTIEDDGTVRGMRDALSALSKSHTFLVKSETTGTTETKPPGTATGNNGNSGAGKPNKTTLASRFPVMRTRAKPQP